MIPTEQAAQIAQAALQTPINNLVVLLALIALLIMALGGVLVWKFAPTLINLYKQQAETNSKLTQIVGQNSEQARLAMSSVDKNTAEMVKQTAAIEVQTTIIQAQGKDLSVYQTLVSDTLSAHTEQIAANTASVEQAKDSIAQIKESIDDLSKQIREFLEDKAACDGAEELIKKLKEEILEIVRQQQTKRATQTNSAIVVVPGEPIPVVSGMEADKMGLN